MKGTRANVACAVVLMHAILVVGVQAMAQEPTPPTNYKESGTVSIAWEVPDDSPIWEGDAPIGFIETYLYARGRCQTRRRPHEDWDHVNEIYHSPGYFEWDIFNGSVFTDLLDAGGPDPEGPGHGHAYGYASYEFVAFPLDLTGDELVLKTQTTHYRKATRQPTMAWLDPPEIHRRQEKEGKGIVRVVVPSCVVTGWEMGQVGHDGTVRVIPWIRARHDEEAGSAVGSDVRFLTKKTVAMELEDFGTRVTYSDTLMIFQGSANGHASWTWDADEGIVLEAPLPASSDDVSSNVAFSADFDGMWLTDAPGSFGAGILDGEFVSYGVLALPYWELSYAGAECVAAQLAGDYVPELAVDYWIPESFFEYSPGATYRVSLLCILGGGVCAEYSDPSPVAVTEASWGRIKALYR